MHQENRTILIVDDEPETLKGYKEFLGPKSSSTQRRSSRMSQTNHPRQPEAEGYNLLLASGGEEAIAIVKSEMSRGRRVAAGFFDVKLEGGMDGLATINAIKAMDKDIHCVVVTAYHDRSVEEMNEILGEDFKDQWDYLNKPFTQGEIVQKARQMVAAWNNKRKLEAMHAQVVRNERFAAVAQVARGVGHEFGNILLRIMGKTDMALMETDPPKIHGHLKVVMTAAERAGVIIRNLQSLSRVEPNLVSASIKQPLDEALTLISHELSKNSVDVETKYDEVPELQLDVGAMAQVFLNLLINAMHAMPKGGKITCTVEKADGPAHDRSGVMAKIADSGTGIPEDVLPRIFEFAFTTKGNRGSGLGLSVSKDIIESHRGRISVKTEVGEGTEFSVWLPLNE